MRLLVNNDSKPAMCLGSCDQSANRYPHDLRAKERRAETRFKWQSMWIAISEGSVLVAMANNQSHNWFEIVVLLQFEGACS